MVSTSVIWVSILVSGLFSPDLISGSNQQHLPLVLWTGWLWGLFASMFSLRLFRDQFEMNVLKFQTVAISVIWVIVALTSVFAPPLVTGSGPTYLPLAALIAPFIGSILTAGVWFIWKSLDTY